MIYWIVLLKYLELTTNPLIIPKIVSPSAKYELRNLLSVLSWIILVAGLILAQCYDRRDVFKTHAKPVDFLIPAIIVENATRSNASLVNLFNPNMLVLICFLNGWSNE